MIVECTDKIHRQNITCCTGKSGDWERTVQIFEALQDSNLKADVWTFTSLINACQSCGNDWKSGIEIFQDMEAQGKKQQQKMHVASSQASPQACSSRLSVAILLTRMLLVSYNSSHVMPCETSAETLPVWIAGIDPNVHAYTSLISLCQRAGQWRKAMQIFRRMEAADIKVDVVAYNSAIAACAKGGDWEQAWAVFSSK